MNPQNIVQHALSLPHLLAQMVASIFWTFFALFADTQSTLTLSIALVNAIAALVTATAALVKISKKREKAK